MDVWMDRWMSVWMSEKGETKEMRVELSAQQTPTPF